MNSADVITYCATLAAAVTALVVLVREGHWRLSRTLTAFVGAWGASDALILAWPETLWTPEFCAAREAALAVLCVLATLELGRGVLGRAARVWSAVCWRVAWLLVPLTVAGVLGLMTLAGVPRVGYRGLLVVDAVVAGLLALVLSAISLYELPRHPLAVTALRGLVRFFAVQVVYLGSWEASKSLAQVVGWVATATFVWAMLAIAREGMSKVQPSILTAVRVSK